MRVPGHRNGILPSSACNMPPRTPLCLFVSTFVIFFTSCFALVVSLTSNSYFTSFVAVGGGLCVFRWSWCFMLCVARTLAFANPPRAVSTVLSVDIEHTIFIAGVVSSSYCAWAQALQCQSTTGRNSSQVNSVQEVRHFNSVPKHLVKDKHSIIRRSTPEGARFPFSTPHVDLFDFDPAIGVGGGTGHRLLLQTLW